MLGHAIIVIIGRECIFVTGFFPVGLVSIAKTFDRETRGMATGYILIFSVLLGGGLIPYLLGLSGDLVGFRFGIVLLGIVVTDDLLQEWREGRGSPAARLAEAYLALDAPAAMIQAVRSVVHEQAKPAHAFKLYQTLKNESKKAKAK